MAGPDFSLLSTLVSGSVGSISGSVLSVFMALVALAVVFKSALLVVGAIRGEKVEFNGKRWDKDVWQAAMADLEVQKRCGVRLDAEAKKALRYNKRIS